MVKRSPRFLIAETCLKVPLAADGMHDNLYFIHQGGAVKLCLM